MDLVVTSGVIRLFFHAIPSFEFKIKRMRVTYFHKCECVKAPLSGIDVSFFFFFAGMTCDMSDVLLVFRIPSSCVLELFGRGLLYTRELMATGRSSFSFRSRT